ncbi:MAG: hypothetical protein QXD46_06875 [Thermofilum sp.]
MVSKVTVFKAVKTLPYEVGRIAAKPGTRPYIFHVKLGGEAVQAIGIIAEVGQIFASKGLGILHFKAVAVGDAVRLIIIADLKGAEDLAPKIAEEIRRKVKFCEEVIVDPPIAEGVAIDRLSFPTLFGGGRAIVMRNITYEGLIKSGWERFGSAYAVLLYSAGFEAGRNAFKAHKELAQLPEVLERVAEALFQMFGYGILELVRVDDAAREAVARVHHSFECELFRGAGEPRGSFVRGMLAGWLAERWGVTFEEMVAREEKCVAKGDEYCEYKFSLRRRK